MADAARLPQVASNRGSRARLLAVMVRTKRERTRSMPRHTVCAIPTDGLRPPERLLNPLPVLSGTDHGPGAGWCVRRSVNNVIVSRGLRCHAGLTQVSDKRGSVICSVCPKGQPAGRSGGVTVTHATRGAPFGTAVGFSQISLNDQAAAVLYQRMADEAPHGAGAGRLFALPFLHGRASGSGVEAGVAFDRFLPPEVDLSAAVLAGGAGHRAALGLGLFRLVGGGRGWRSRVVRALVIRGCDVRLRRKAFHGRPSLDQRSVDPEPKDRAAKCAFDKNGATSRCARIAAITLRGMSVVSSRSRFLVNTVGTQT